jgi:8-oxo-dGTP diphosphatase
MDKKWSIVNVEAAIFHEDKWLMIVRSLTDSHAPGRISLPGGKVEEARDKNQVFNVLENTLKQEIQEEVGVTIEEKMEYLVSTTFISDNGNPVVNIAFLCKYIAGTPKITHKNEVADIQWMTFDEIMKNPKTISGIRIIMEVAVKKRLESFNTT